MNIILRILTVAILVGGFLVTPLITTWASSTVWRWYVARDLGPGPSQAAWYGIWTIIIMYVAIVYARMAKLERDKDKKRGWDAASIGATRIIVTWIVVPSSVGLCWVVGQVLGWL